MTVFTSKVIDQKGNSFSVNCRLWKPTNEKVRLFCTLNEILYFNISEIILNNVSYGVKLCKTSIIKPSSMACFIE